MEQPSNTEPEIDPSDEMQFDDDQLQQFANHRIWQMINAGIKKRIAILDGELRICKAEDLAGLQRAIRELEMVLDSPLKIIDYRKGFEDGN